MFGDRFTRKNVVNISGNTVVANRINQGSRVDGNIHTDTDIRIDGQIFGDVHCLSKVVIGQSGEVMGNLDCGDLTIEGKVKGKINCSGTLYFRKTADFEGEVRFVKLIVEDGADIRASLTRIPQNGWTESDHST